MGLFQVKTGLPILTSLIDGWCNKYNFTKITKEDNNFESTSVDKNLKGRSFLYNAIWQCQSINGGVYINMSVRLNIFFAMILDSVIFLGIINIIFLLKDALIQYNKFNTLLSIIICVIIILIIQLKLFFLRKTYKIEKTFWDYIIFTADVEQITPIRDKASDSTFSIIKCSILSFFCIFISVMVAGNWGFIFSALPCIFFLTTTFIELTYKNKVYCDWRFWIVENMTAWSLLILMTFAVFISLILIEFFSSMAFNGSSSISELLDHRTLRDIKPAKAQFLEEDCEIYFYRAARLKIDHVDLTKNIATLNDMINKKVIFFCYLILISVALTLFFFILLPFYLLLRRQKIWIQQLSNNNANIQHPFVPYCSQTWQFHTPKGLYLLLFLHVISSYVFNLAASIFSIDSLSYAAFGQCFIFPKTANLWSWVYAPARLVFGDYYGRITGISFIIVTCIPFLMIITAFIRRLADHITLTIKGISVRHYKINGSFINNEDIQQLCDNLGINIPSIILSNGKTAIINLHYLPLINKPIIKISQGTIDLLNSSELKAAIAHELGHIKQGLWKVSLLKILSCFAFFPNYYLTLCMDWAKKEMEADRIALAITKDSQSLKQALIKMSMGQISYSVVKNRKNVFHKLWGFLIAPVRKKLHYIHISVNFFFGDGLFGYAHPYLTERLQAIDSYKI